MKRIVPIIVLFFSITACFGQYKLKKADKLFDEMAYVDAAKAYEAYIKSEYTPTKQTILKIADTYYYISNYENAQSWYEKYGADALDDTHFNRYIHTLRITEQYNKADKIMRNHLTAKGDKAALNRFENQKVHLDSINNTESLYTISNLDSNTNKADFGTAFYGNKIVYASGKDTTHLGGKIYQWNEQPFLDLFVAERNPDDGALQEETKFMKKAQTRYHNASLVFTPDLQKVYYSTNTVKKHGRLDSAEDGTNNIRIVKGTIADDAIVNTQLLPFNNISYSVAHPALSADGNWLFFTSDMPGGFGETDIYAVAINEDGTYGNPVNLGETINTSGKEMFPFVNGDKLYFASNGHYGLGGLDIFESTITGEMNFTAPKNLGKPVNSNLDDFAYITDFENSYGYFSSNRAGGKGDDDIYYFTRKEPACIHILTGIVTDATSKKPIEGVTIKVGDIYGKVVGTGDVTTDAEGRYILEEVPCNFYIMTGAFKKGYSTDTDDVTTPGAPSGEVIMDFELVKYDNLIVKEDNVEKIKIEPIYFDFDKYDITPQAATELDKVVFVLENFPDIVIKIESHTDSRGNDDYNMKLSDNRAKATYAYIMSKGIVPERIESVKGYGESQLRNKCSNGIECTEEEHLYNRRSDFIIVQK
ncbi:OmpA family protein [Flavobacterium salilacus subsp. salilacus]|uniref:OmpA family protein n=1 Tax=Flavobacterium TaxID=237 RepID=UPI001075632D|nr:MULTISPECIES: OmpA family protein [Flavobacterium]KAF2519490.1 OmpA family protein [Flavobacterium salilacus subsp. salilacus]MBE1614613.1 OmpA family protein [Flavobacterium sp. SaA2.13]